MPIFEFQCRQCQRQFEVLVRGSESPGCPECGSPALDKLISAPAAHVAGRSQLPVTSACPPSDAPPCGPSCCRLP